MDSRVSLPLTAAAGVVAGFFIGRQTSGSSLRKALNGNYKWMTRQERAVASALLHSGQGYIFRSWPRPGVRDEEKRALLAAAARHVSSTGGSLEAERQGVLVAPVAPKLTKQLQAHGDVRIDDYYWLRDDDRKDSRVLSHIKAENEYTRAVLADTEKLQEELAAEMRRRIQEADQSVPERYGGFMYYTRTLEGAQYKVHCRRALPANAGAPTEEDVLDESVTEEVLLDENKRKEEGKHSFYMVGAAEPSPNHKLYAWTEDTVGGEKYTLHVKDLASGSEVMEPLPGTSGDVEWAADNATLFYVVKDHLDRPYKVLRHKIGTPASQDVVVYEEKDDRFYVGIGKTRSQELLVISSGSAVTSECRVLPANTPEGEFQVVLPRVQDVEYSISHRSGHLYMLVREPSKPNSELRVMPLAKAGGSGNAEAQRVLIPHSREVKLESISLSKDYLVLFERSQGLQRARVYRLPADGSAHEGTLAPEEGQEVMFDEPAYSLEGGGTGDFDSQVLRLYYTSLTTPSSTIDMHMVTGKRKTKKVAPVLGGFVQSAYVTKRVWATAPDGVKVPISIVYRKDLAKLDGTDPMLLNGYGSYEISNDPYFTSNRLSLLDRGWIFAIAHIRGGGEMGRYWYEDGKFLAKKNTFTDFIACAEHLVALEYTQPSRLAIEGRSAGGLLMGAVLNMRPDLFHAALVGVGFVDCLTTISDETIPLTAIEWEEWGNPSDPKYYAYIKSYSPVDNVKPQPYPHILATAGLHDPRVGYWEPAKFVAKLRELKTDHNLLLFKCDMGAGHFSVTGRFDRLKEVALEYAFLLKVFGMTDAKPVPISTTV